VIRFLHEYVAGLRQEPGSAGWERFEIQPVPGGGVTSASYRFMSPRGAIDAAWMIDDGAGDFRLDVTVPAGSTARVTMPDGTTAPYGPGRHRVSCPTPCPHQRVLLDPVSAAAGPGSTWPPGAFG
jgi:alpha-L-rhamnosidase